MKVYRHGDVLIRPVQEIPEEAQKVRRQKGRLILAEGEATGHAHAILDRDVDLYELVTPGDADEMRRRFLRVEAEAGASLVHEEHHTLTIPPGDYEIIGQVEFEPERLRRVED